MYDNLIDEYLGKVTRDMGPGQKTEVENELRTHILDTADALAAERKTTVDDAIISEVIRNMVPASKLAVLYPTPGTFLQMKRLRDAIFGLGGIAAAFLLVAGILWLVSPDTLNTFPATVILSIVGALALIFIVVTLICAVMYLYEATLKVPYEARLKRLEKSISDAGSPLKVFIAIFGTVVWLLLLNLFWPIVPFLASFGTNTHIVPLLSSDFAGFLPWFNLLGILTIAVQLLFLAVRKKWLPSLLEAALTACTAMLHLWVLSVFPFNPVLSAGIQSGIRVLLAVLIMLMLVDAASKLWKTARLFMMNMATIDQKGGII